MEQTREKTKFLPCPVRLGVTLLALSITAAYYLLRSSGGVMQWVYTYVTGPWHVFMSRLCAAAGFSVAELLISLAAVGTAVYIIYSVILLIFQKRRGRRVYIMLITLAMLLSLVWMGFSVLWGPCYYVPSFSERSGLDDGPVSVSDLAAVTGYFAAVANDRSGRAERNEAGVFAAPRDGILDRAARVFEGASDLFPQLEGEALRPKPMVFSRMMSAMNFTGFFFPLTGEANLNMDAPACLLPATAEHELAHQRGVAEEQECNFIAVLACMESGDDDFTYSGALMAYIYLGNALYSADYEAWQDISASLSGAVRADLSQINSYWAAFSDSGVQKASDRVYEAFLQSNGQTLGLKSYGACVDLLVHYYLPVCGVG